MGKGMKGVIEQMKAPAPDFAAIKTGADAIAMGAPKIAGYFPKGTGPEAGVKTEALPVIWEKNAEFQQDAANLVAASKGLQAAAATNDIGQVKEAFMKVGGACKACHDTFREKD
jgi:cytochrome c556